MAKKVGRPKKKIDWKEFGKLCQMLCTLEEISGWFNVSEDTIERRVKEEKKCNFADFYKMHSAKGKISLRRAQFKSALGGNAALLIWMGKQVLGQKDKYDGDTGVKPQPIKIEIIAEDGRIQKND